MYIYIYIYLTYKIIFIIGYWLHTVYAICLSISRSTYKIIFIMGYWLHTVYAIYLSISRKESICYHFHEYTHIRMYRLHDSVFN